MEKTMQYAMTTIVALSVCVFSSCCDYVTGERTTNQSGGYSAFTKGSECGGAVGSYESSVKVERQCRLFGHRVWTSTEVIFDARVKVDRLKLQWIDEHHLLVACSCKREAVEFDDPRWRDITIEYKFSQQ
jgi:hypothetical protein